MTDMKQRIAEEIHSELWETWGIFLSGDPSPLVRSVLRAMRGDPGHDATAGVVAPCGDRSEALRIWNGMIDAMLAVDEPMPSGSIVLDNLMAVASNAEP